MAKSFRVAGVTKQNENDKDIQSLLKRIASSYKRDGLIESWDGYTKKEMLEDGIDGSEFEDQEVKGIARLVKDPTNQFDPNAIKVYLKDANGTEHHVGYVKNEDNKDVSELLNDVDANLISVEFTGGKVRSIDYDVMEDKDFFEEEELTRGLLINFKDKVIPNIPEKPESPSRPTFLKVNEKPKSVNAGEKMQASGEKVKKAGGAVMGCGCLLTIFITIPIIIFLFFM